MRDRGCVWLVTIAFLALTGCTRPAGEPPPNAVASSVAATRLFVQRNLLSATPLPTVTDLPSVTPSPLPSLTLTSPVTPGPSPSPSGIPLSEDDPRAGLNLSVPDYLDDFSQRFLWFEFSSPDSATILWSEGELSATDHRKDPFIWWTTSAVQGGNGYAEVEVTIDQCEIKDGYGLGLRVGGENYDRGYALEFSCDGSYRIRKFISGSAPQVLLDWTSTEAIQPGSNQANTLGFLAEGSDLFAFANGELLNPEPVQDGDYGYGIFSLYPMAGDSEPVNVTFDDFRYWAIVP